MDQILYAIKSIKEIEFFVDESKDLEESIDFFHNANIHSNVESEEIRITISAHYRKTGSTDDYFRSKTATVFTIQRMKELVFVSEGKESINLPDPLWVTLYGVSFSHARAMLARSIAGTKYSPMIMPLINPEEQFKRLFSSELNQNKGTEQ